MAEVEVLGGQGVTPEANPYESQVSPSDINKKSVLEVDIGASTMAVGGDLREAIDEARGKSSVEIKKEAGEAHLVNQQDLSTQVLEETAITSPEDLAATITVVGGNLQQAREDIEAEIAPYLAWVDSMPGSEKLTLEERRSVAVDRLFLDPFTRALDEQSLWGTTVDFLGMMAVPDESYNAAKVGSEIAGKRIEFEDWLASGTALKEIAKTRQSLKPADRALFDKTLQKVLRNVDDNLIQQFDQALTILGQDILVEEGQALEKADLALLGASGIFRAMSRGMKALNIMNRVADSGDAITTQKASTMATESEETSVAIGVDKFDAASLGNPVAPDDIFVGAPSGLQAKYRTLSGEAQDALDRADNTLNIKAVPNTQEADIVVDSINKHMSKLDEVENVEIEPTVGGFNIKYDQLDGEGNAIAMEQFQAYKLDDFGGFITDEAARGGTVARVLASPNFIAKEDRKLFVQKAEAATYAAGRIEANLGQAIDAALKPIRNKKESLAKVDDILVKLDGTDTELSYFNLVEQGIGGTRLNDNEFISVLGVRKVLDDVWEINNDILRNEMQLKGQQEVLVGGELRIAKPYDNADAAFLALEKESLVLDTNGITRRGLGAEDINQAYRENKILVRNDNANPLEWFETPDGLVDFAFVTRGNIKGLPKVVLNKVNNYLPKMRADANFFIKGTREVKVNGTTRRLPHTVAYANTRSQADRYLAKIEKAAVETGEEFDINDYQIVFDREAASNLNNGDTVVISGGLIRGKRKSTDIDFAGDVVDAERVDAIHSLQRYMSNTADKAALSEWRMEARTRWTNEAAAHPDIGDEIKRVSWDNAPTFVRNSNMPPRQKAKLLTLHSQVSTMSRIPHASDQALQAVARSVGEGFDRAGMENVAKYIYSIHDRSPSDLAKSAVFHLTLGMFSMVQLPVQLFGASVALTVDPRFAPKAMGKWLAASAMDVATDEKNALQLIKRFEKGGVADGKSLTEDYQFWRKSGMREAVMRGNADSAAMMSKLPYDASALRRGYEKALDAGQLPYRMGELGNMRISFFTALERQKALDGKLFKYDDNTLQKVLARAEQYRLNMGPANKAAFQKGVLGLPTQFKQIYTKYIEALTGDFFTPKEKMKLVTGQAVLFGAAGVPIINHFSDTIASWFYDEETATAEDLSTFKRGAMGYLFNEKLGIDALISGRLTVSADLIEEFTRTFTDERTPLIKSMLGASFTTGDKFYDLAVNSIFAGNMLYDSIFEENSPQPVWKEAAWVIGESVANIPASSRKWLMAEDMVNGFVRKSDGTLLMEVDADLVDVAARAIGFGSQTTDDLFRLAKANLDVEQRKRDRVAQYVNAIHILQKRIDAQDEGGVEAAHVALAVMKDQIWRMDPKDARDIMDRVHKKLVTGDNFASKTVKTAIENMYSEFTRAANEMNIEKQRELLGE